MIEHSSEPAHERNDPTSANLPRLKLSSKRFIDDLSTDLLVTSTEATRAFELLQQSLSELILASGHLSICGLGTFELRLRKEHDGFIPSSSASIHISERVGVHFTPGKALKRDIATGDMANFARESAVKSRPPIYLVGSPNSGLKEALLERFEARGHACRENLIDLMTVSGIVSLSAARCVVKSFTHSLTHQLSELLASSNSEAEQKSRRVSVRIPSIGSFSIVERAGRDWLNPQTGERFNIDKHNAVTFKVSERLKDSAQSRLEFLRKRENVSGD